MMDPTITADSNNRNNNPTGLGMMIVKMISSSPFTSPGGGRQLLVIQYGTHYMHSS